MLVAIKEKFSVSDDWTIDVTDSFLTSASNTKGEFRLTFSTADGTLKYTLINTETDPVKANFWSVFNTDHSIPQDAQNADTLDEINALINDAYDVATLFAVNKVFIDDSWDFDTTDNWLTKTIDDKGTFKLTFTMDDATLKYTLAETAASDGFWSVFNTAHAAPQDAQNANTPDEINAFINDAYETATEEAPQKTSAYVIILLIIAAFTVATVALFFVYKKFRKS